MKVISDVDEMRRFALASRKRGNDVALVPTMGALHAGHLSLLSLAREAAPVVIVSVFVNPSQFGPNEDFGRYPRDLAGDLKRLEEVDGVDAVFAPTVDDIYANGVSSQVIRVVPRSLTDHLCGPFRPGHFEGVTTIVAKLFNSCMPTVAVFGRKDAQQFVIIRRMALDLNFGIEIVGGPTVREPDGLALSSRNKYLNEEARAQATVLHDAVSTAQRLILEGESNPVAVVDAMKSCVALAPLANLQYAEVVDGESLQPMSTLSGGDHVVAAVAVHFGETRLIDNVFERVPENRRARR